MKRNLVLHKVLFTFKDGIDWGSSLATKAEAITMNHSNEIGSIYGWQCGRNTIKREISADFSLLGIFKSHRDLDEYMKHPDHKKGVDAWSKISTWKVSDINIDMDKLKLMIQG